MKILNQTVISLSLTGIQKIKRTLVMIMVEVGMIVMKQSLKITNQNHRIMTQGGKNKKIISMIKCHNNHKAPMVV